MAKDFIFTVTTVGSYQIYLWISIRPVWQIKEKKMHSLYRTSEYKTKSECGIKNISLLLFMLHIYLTEKGCIDKALYVLVYVSLKRFSGVILTQFLATMLNLDSNWSMSWDLTSKFANHFTVRVSLLESKFTDPSELINLAKLQDTRSIPKNQLYF